MTSSPVDEAFKGRHVCWRRVQSKFIRSNFQSACAWTRRVHHALLSFSPFIFVPPQVLTVYLSNVCCRCPLCGAKWLWSPAPARASAPVRASCSPNSELCWLWTAATWTTCTKWPSSASRLVRRRYTVTSHGVRRSRCAARSRRSVRFIDLRMNLVILPHPCDDVVSRWPIATWL